MIELIKAIAAVAVIAIVFIALGMWLCGAYKEVRPPTQEERHEQRKDAYRRTGEAVHEFLKGAAKGDEK